jgi:hypothetical protein
MLRLWVILNIRIHQHNKRDAYLKHLFNTYLLGPLLFLLYINDLPYSINENNKIVLFADDTSLIISNPDPIKFRDDANKILQHIQEWFNANLISLNWEKTHFMYFTTKNNSFSNFDIMHKDKKLTTFDSITFLGLTRDNSQSW